MYSSHPFADQKRVALDREGRSESVCHAVIPSDYHYVEVSRSARNRVVEPRENRHGDYCIDIFVRPDGTFGFEEYRRDAEDRGGWQSLNRYSLQVFSSERDALAEAKAYVAWLKDGSTRQ